MWFCMSNLCVLTSRYFKMKNLEKQLGGIFETPLKMAYVLYPFPKNEYL